MSFKQIGGGFILLCAFVIGSTVASAGEIQPPEDGEVLAGFDLYQLTEEFGKPSGTGAGGGPVGPPRDAFGDFAGLFVTDDPLAVFDFGSGPVDVGNTSIIVERLEDAFLTTEGATTVPIEMVALSLRSVDPVDLGSGEDFHFVTLDPSTPSLGNYGIEFFGVDEGGFLDGFYTADLTINYDIRIGSPTGPVVQSGQQFVSGSTDWNSIPFAEDVFISGVNGFLNGLDQTSDFFQFEGLPLFLQDEFDGKEFTFLSVEHADESEPGDTPGNPILPDDTPGGSFFFQDEPQRGWFDPVTASGYIFETDGNSQFVTVGAPPLAIVPDADGMYTIDDGTSVVSLAAGGFYNFPTPVDRFILRGIDPEVDGTDPAAFPTFLAFNAFSNTFTQTPIPEPAAAILLLLGSILVGLRRSRE